MKHTFIGVICCCFSFFNAIAQDGSKVNWTTGLSWPQILLKAQSEGKYIFIDCYATWCKPCKYMDAKVYSDTSIGKLVNQKFLSIQIQLDSTQNDSESIKKMYPFAKDLAKIYSVNTLPTYLFFSSAGVLLHRDVGAKSVDQFKEVIFSAQDPKKQYYTLKSKYKTIDDNSKAIPYLINFGRAINDVRFTDSVANNYVDKYLIKLPHNKLYQKETLQDIIFFTSSSNLRAFKFIFDNQEVIDSVLGRKNTAQSTIDGIITREEISPLIKLAKNNGSDPQWQKMIKSISEKFDKSFSSRTVLVAQVNWYYEKNWKLFNQYFLRFLTEYGLDPKNSFSDVYLNNMVWYGILSHSTQKKQLELALQYMEALISRHKDVSSYFDTYANLLYRLDKKDLAIKMEEQAILLDPKSKDLPKTLEKMRRGVKIWPKINN